MENAEEFLSAVRKYDDSIESLDDAIMFGLENSEQIDDMKWMGEFAGGVFYSDSEGSQWFDGMTRFEALMALSQQLLDQLQG